MRAASPFASVSFAMGIITLSDNLAQSPGCDINVAHDLRIVTHVYNSLRDALQRNSFDMADAAAEYRATVSRAENVSVPVLLNEQLPGLAENPLATERWPQLILTSPPYPGVYVLYHRWKIGGRRESPAPF